MNHDEKVLIELENHTLAEPASSEDPLFGRIRDRRVYASKHERRSQSNASKDAVDDSLPKRMDVCLYVG